MKTNHASRRGFTLVELLVVIVIIAALAGLTAPMVIKQRKKADQTEAVSNARQIGLAMFEFETAYGSFPDSTTATTVKENTETQLTLGTANSNDYFRQLIAAEVCQSEAMFYCKTAFSKKPDNIYNTSEKALASGEVGFGYIMNDQLAFSTAGNPARPIVVAPLLYPFETGKFDTDLYDFKAVVLRIDNSVQSLPILKSTKLVQLGGSKNLLSVGDDTIWGTNVTPKIISPDPKK
jgi:prepilin-type N-terminal cleavage/methylation domain-containing protein